MSKSVRTIGIIQCGVPLISNTIDNVYGNAQVDIADGWYLITHSSTGQKRQQIEKISETLNLELKVEIIMNYPSTEVWQKEDIGLIKSSKMPKLAFMIVATML